MSPSIFFHGHLGPSLQEHLPFIVMFRLFVSSFLPLATALVLCSCASVSVKKSETLVVKRLPASKPEKIFIRPFTFDDATLRVDRSGEALETFKYDLQERMTRHLVRRLSKHVAPAEAVAATAPLPRGNYWVVEGHFVRVNQGSRMLRALIGLGTGGTKMETLITVRDLSTKPPTIFLTLETTGGSNLAPGVLGASTFFFTGITALTSVANALEGLRSGVTFDTVRTSREVTAGMSEYLYQKGAIPYEEALGPKRPGSLPYRWWPSNGTTNGTAKPKPTGTVTVTPAE